MYAEVIEKQRNTPILLLEEQIGGPKSFCAMNHVRRIDIPPSLSLRVCVCFSLDFSHRTPFGSWQLLLSACNQFTAILMTIDSIAFSNTISIRLFIAMHVRARARDYFRQHEPKSKKKT